MKYPSGKNVIGYSLKSAGNRFFFGVNPAAETELPNQFIEATTEEVNEACALANAAFNEYSMLPVEVRSNFINAIVAEIMSNADALCELMTLETGLPLSRAKTELKRAIYQFEDYLKGLTSGYVLQEKVDLADGTNPLRTVNLQKKNVAIGPVVVFGASNFPFAYSTLGGDVASALVAGCPVIVKAHALHPNTAALSAECIVAAARKTGMPEGVFSQLYSNSFTVGEDLLKHPLVCGVGFTGSVAGGKALLKLAGEREIPIPVYAEMGSVNPVVICADALESGFESIADKLADSVSGGAGQFCTSPGIVFLEGDAERFINRLIGKLNLVEPQCMLGKSIKDNYLRRKEEIAALFQFELDGKVEKNFIQPSVVLVSSSEFTSNKILHEEVFGAFVCIVKCKNLNEIKEGLNVLDGQLTGSVFTNSETNFEQILPVFQRKVGRIIINGVPTGVEVSIAQQHGGPFPSSSSFITAVGIDAILRWMKPLAIQNLPKVW